VVLVRVLAERADLRAVLREILSAWTGLSTGELPLRETPRGPVWPGEWQGDSLGISFSYAGDEGWIGLLRGGRIGVDVATVEHFSELKAVVRDYLGPLAREATAKSPEPERAFARAWAELEAQIKCVGSELREWPPAHAQEMTLCRTESWMVADDMVMAVAQVGSGPRL
jgi:phosphopantetheinyl transferase